jgi:alcohol dehydrogenase YqhD (iron-dependent ADH family)
MENFVIYNPTKVIFGKNAIEKLPKYIPSEIQNVLLLYGQGSILKNGIFKQVTAQLKLAGIEWKEFSGIRSNPLIEHVREAVEIVKENALQGIIAVGGGSVIDSAKAIAASAYYHGDPWDLFNGRYKPESVLPLFTVLTLAATGTEMNSFSVVQNEQQGLKGSFASPYVYPVISFLDPEYTMSVPSDYTGYGLTDVCAHAMEAFFGHGDAPLSDRFVASIINEILIAGPALLKDLHNYDLRARVMYAATMALNNLTVYGRVSGDWGVHGIGHELSLFYNIPHGATLSVVYPAWLRLQADRIPLRISRFGVLVFGTGVIRDVIRKTEQMFEQFECPIRLQQLGIEQLDEQLLLANLEKNKVSGYAQELQSDDYLKLIEYMKLP